MEAQPKRTIARFWPLLLAAGLLGVFLIMFLIEILSFDAGIGDGVESLDADAYLEHVEPLLENANPENGETLIQEYDCFACHVAGAVSNAAPAFEGLGERAATRREPLTAAAYIYESILYPAAHVVADYPNVMPQNYPQRLSREELGDLIAYLLLQ